MEHGRLSIDARAWNLPVWCLRCVVVVQCFGAAWLYLFSEFETESSIYGLLFFERVCAETLAQQIDDWGMWAFLISGGALLVIPLVNAFDRRVSGRQLAALPPLLWQTPLLLYVAAWQFAMAATQAYRGGSLLAEWSVGSQAVRIAAPLALLLFLPRRNETTISVHRANGAIWLMRLAAAATFTLHGLKAFQRDASFIDLVVGSGQNLLSWDLSQDAIEVTLMIIGITDFALVVLLVLRQWRPIAAYMALWGIITALSRVTSLGWMFFGETLVRAANGGLPLAVYLYWSYRHRIMPNNPQPEEEAIDFEEFDIQ